VKAHRGVARGVAWSYSAYAVEAVVGLALVAYVVRHVGMAEYGILILGLSIAAVAAILDLGLLGLLVQACIATREREGRDAASRLLSAAFIYLVGIGGVAFLVCTGISLALPGPFRIDPSLVGTAATVLTLAGAALLFQLPGTALELAHAASGSFGRISRIQIIVVVFRASLTVLAITMGSGVVALAIIHVGAAALRVGLFFAGLEKHTGGLAIGRSPDWNAVKALRGNRTWAASDNIFRQAASSANPIVLGILASSAAIAAYSVAARIPGHLFALLNRGIGVTLPYLSGQHAREEHAEIRVLFASTTLVAVGILLPVCVLGIIAAPEILGAIGGASYVSAAPVLRLLLVATFVQGFSVPAYQVLYARGLVSTAARIGVAESIASVALTVALVPRFGAAGAAAATAVTHSIGTFGWFFPAALRAAGMSLADLVRLMTGVARRQLAARV
jgi:O-antigen/teichoic acid export membrane protein